MNNSDWVKSPLSKHILFQFPCFLSNSFHTLLYTFRKLLFLYSPNLSSNLIGCIHGEGAGLLIVFESSWESKEVPEDLNTSVFKKGKKGDPGNYSVVSLTMIPWKVMGKIILEAISKSIIKVWPPSHQEWLQTMIMDCSDQPDRSATAGVLQGLIPGKYWLSSSSMAWTMRQTALSASVVIHTGEEWLIHPMDALPFRGASAGWRDGLTGNSWRSTKQNAKPCT